MKNLDNLYIHLRRRILIRGNLLGYGKLSKVQKDMGALEENHRERKRTKLDPSRRKGIFVDTLKDQRITEYTS